MAAPVPQTAKGGQSGTGYARILPALLLPSWLMIGFFMVVPVVMMLIFSFLTREFRGGVIWQFSLDAYVQFFIDRGLFGDEPARLQWTYIGIFWRSIWQAGLATIFCLLIGFPTAWFIATRPAQQRALWVFLITVPYWVNLLIRTVSMRFLLRDQGPFNEFLLWAGLIDAPLRIVNTDVAVQIALFYSYLPFMVLPIYAAVERYNFTLTEAARDLYASRWVALREIVIPVVKPGIVAGCILVFIPSMGSFLAPNLLGGARTYMIGSLIEEQFKGSMGNWPFGAAASMILLSMVLLVLMVYARLQARAEVR